MVDEANSPQLDEALEALRSALRVLDELGLQLAAAHVSMAIDILEKPEDTPAAN